MDLQALKERIESTYDATVAAILPLNYEMVRLASSGIFVTRYPEHPFTLEMERVANQILA
jgi:septum site-determining protein MinD